MARSWWFGEVYCRRRPRTDISTTVPNPDFKRAIIAQLRGLSHARVKKMSVAENR